MSIRTEIYECYAGYRAMGLSHEEAMEYTADAMSMNIADIQAYVGDSDD